MGDRAEVVDRDHAADADAGDARAEGRETLIAVSGTLGGITGLVALFVVAGTFSLVMAQRRREIAALRALGATPRQIRRLVAGEALIVSVVAGALGLVAGAPLADGLVSVLASHDVVPEGFRASGAWIAPASAFVMGVGISQLAVFAAARRAGRTAPAEALNEAAVEHARPSVVQVLAGVLLLGGGFAMSLIFSGFWAQAFAVLGGHAARGRRRDARAAAARLPRRAALLAAARARRRRACSPRRTWAPTAGARPRWPRRWC